jgi:hypothetical protein
MDGMKTMTREEWVAEGTRLFGEDMFKWKFECPVCHHVASVKDWKDLGANENAVAFNCVGRYIPGSAEALSTNPRNRKKSNGHPCNYTGGGLFKLNPITVDGHNIFAFAGEI